MNWYSHVSRDLAKLPDCIDYFESELIDASKECKVIGNLEKAAAALPGIVEQRYNQLQEIEAVLEYLNIELRKLKSKYFRKYLENYNRALSQKECDRYVEGEVEVADFEIIINEFFFK